MTIAFSSDRTGFPLIHLTDLGFDVHLLPITRLQFGQYAAGNQALEELVKPEPESGAEATGQISQLRGVVHQPIEKKLVTGVLPDEAFDFGVWLDNEEPTSDYALPTVKQWRDVYNCLQYERCEPFVEEIFDNTPAPEAQKMLRTILDQHPNTLVELSLMRGGVVEWVQQGANWVGLGNPKPMFYPNTFEPLKETVEPVDSTQRMGIFGFRLIRVF